MNENANRPTPGNPGSQPLRWDNYGQAQPQQQSGAPTPQPGQQAHQQGQQAHQQGQQGHQRHPYRQPGNPYAPPAQHYGPPTAPYGQPVAQYGPTDQYGRPSGQYGQPPLPPPPPYGPGGWGHPYPMGPQPGPAARRRRHALPAALAGGAAALVLGAAVLLNGGSITLPTSNSTSSGSSANGTATSTTTPDYDTGVVDITAILGSQNGVAAGTGMILDANGTVLTNNHVVDGATSITATDVNTGKQYSASIVGTNANHDIAVIQLRNASGLTPVSIGNSSSVTVGQKVVAIGNAEGRGGTPSVVTGSVTALDQTITAADSSGGNAETLNGLIQVNANIVPGDSGGPLTDTSGKVIGIDTAASASQAAQSGSGNGGFSDGFGSGGSNSGGFGSRGFGSGGFRSRSGTSSGETQGFAIPIQSALTVAKQIESGQSDSGSSSSTGGHGFLGVSVTDGSSSGAAVAGTVVGSPAASAGIGSGDTITAVNGTSVSSAEDLSQLLANTKAGQSVNVSWVDSSGATHSATVTLMSGGA